MEPPLDKIDNFLSGVSTNWEQLVITGFNLLESPTMFSSTDQSSCVSKNSAQSPVRQLKEKNVQSKGHLDQQSSLREWLNSRSQSLSESTVKESKHNLENNGINMVETVETALETIVQSKEELRHHFKTSNAGNTLNLHFDHHKKFFHMINCISGVGNKYEDYSMVTSEKVLSNVHKHLQILEVTDKKIMEVQHLLINTAADTEEIRSKKLLKTTL